MKKIVQVGYCTDDSEVFNGRRVNFKIDEDEQLIGLHSNFWLLDNL